MTITEAKARIVAIKARLVVLEGERTTWARAPRSDARAKELTWLGKEQAALTEEVGALKAWMRGMRRPRQIKERERAWERQKRQAAERAVS